MGKRSERGAALWALLLLPAWAATGGWHYRNAQQGFGLQLPSTDWKQVNFRQGVVAFRDQPAHAEVGVQVRTESESRYRVGLQNFKHVAATFPNLLQKPHFVEGKTPHGLSYSYIELIEMSADDNQPVVIGISYLRLNSKRTVLTSFQAHLTVKKNQLDRPEIQAREADSQRICVSVDQE